MIKKVVRLDSCGIFSGWTWPAGLEDFARYNVLFGWNYSGKTTLSRAIRAHEAHEFSAPPERLPGLRACLADGEDADAETL